MDFLGTLLSPRARLGEDAPPLALTAVNPDKLDASTTPPALYALIKGGGWAVWDKATASALAQRSFSVFEHEVTPPEATWLARYTGWAQMGSPPLIWFATCPTGARVDSAGLPVCGLALPPGAQEIPPRPGSDRCSVNSIPEVAEGSIRPGELEAARRLAPPGTTMCYRYFGGNPEVTDAQVNSARETVRVYDRLLRSVEQVEAHRSIYGGQFTPAQQNALTFARVWLASNAQPVEKARSYLFSGTKNQRRASRFGIGPLMAWVGITVAVAMAVASVSVAVSVLSNNEVRKKGIEAQVALNEAMQPRIDELVACAQDASRSEAQRRSCVQALRALGPITANLDPDKDASITSPTDWGAVAKWGAVGLGIAGAVYLVGPALRGASKATGEAFRVSEQKSRTRRKIIEDIAR